MTGEEREGDGAEDGGDPPTLAAGTIVGRYRIIQLIGRGGMGVVYRAEHVDLGTLRALKTLAPELAHDPRARSRFLKEAKAAARIEHPHVVKVFDCGEHEGIPFFVMDHLDGEDLETLLTRSTLTAEQTAGIMLAICAATSEMHQEGLIHRDLKPGNIFLARNKVRDIVPTVLDFGIARAIERSPSATRTQAGVIVGSVHYIAPEQLLDLPATELTDQYALGVVLYRCVTGVLPFTGDQALSIYRRIATFEPVRPRQIRPELPAAFEDLILRAMSERPADRFASMYELGKALLPFASPKHRTVWFDYYDRQRSPQGLVSMPIPVAESAAWWARDQVPVARRAGAPAARRTRVGRSSSRIAGAAPLALPWASLRSGFRAVPTSRCPSPTIDCRRPFPR
jgi:serine/threonine-protein kinase